jgi:hypothetical protein
LASLTARDFLRRIGFPNARVKSVRLLLRAYEGTQEVYSMGVGYPVASVPPGTWDGHLVVTLPDEGFLIDTTLYEMLRPQWRDRLKPMMAVPLCPVNEVKDGRKRLALALGPDEHLFFADWFAAPENKGWRNKADQYQRHWRNLAVAKLTAFYNSFPQPETA